ncbi:MAG: disulfide bond formation protein B [Candidatus Nomurabacteria bacterium]|nr:disulfide bond formation protein B [Candidatus Nomurabacteria bacterium]USN87735.1 MAG: disulfide bond formation protein B [Candidatus Nomurabacteria bacterium]
MSLLNTLNLLFASGGLVLAVVTIGLYVDYFYNQSKFFDRWLARFAWSIVMVTTIGSVAITLLYSEYFGFVPCSLCWLQRIAMYPQALLSVMAFRMKERVFFPLYSIALSVFGFVVAVYHYIYQMQPKEELANGVMPCLADGSADCATKVIDMFGFVTFPLLSAITFAFLIVVYLNMRRGGRE